MTAQGRSQIARRHKNYKAALPGVTEPYTCASISLQIRGMPSYMQSGLTQAVFCLRKYLNSSITLSTYRAYLAAWQLFTVWFSMVHPGFQPFDQSIDQGVIVALYLVELF